MTQGKTVVVGMSGGVDSSVAAWLLKKQGYQVIALFMKNWEEVDEAGLCSADKDFEDVVDVASQLQIPYYQVNFSKKYWELVFQRCLEDYKRGFTPNPDIHCNQEIKFKAFFEKALELGADYIATGHYCQKVEIEGRSHLVRGLDPEKDQSYFLYTMQEQVLQKVLFPIGDRPKKRVREIAEAEGLATAKKKDSTGICFIGKRDFREFLSRYIQPQEGNFETLEGKVVGKHQGVAFYTLGQRRGLAIGGAGEAWFVIGKEVERNVVLVAQGEEHPCLYREKLTVSEESWIPVAPVFPLRCTAKIRYRTQDVPCLLTRTPEGVLEVTFDQPQRAVTPRQAIVFYQGALCLGGALIQ